MQAEPKVRLAPLHAPQRHQSRTLRDRFREGWTVFSTRPVQVIGLPALLFLGMEREFLLMPLVLILLVMHRIALHLRSRKYLAPDQRANWGAVCVVTSLGLVLLPFYLAYTMYP